MSISDSDLARLGLPGAARFGGRDYTPMLEAAQNLQFYNGYLDTQGMKERNRFKAQFDSARRAFVYDLFRENLDRASILPSVEADLDRIEASELPYGDGAIAEVREALTKHVGAATRHSPLMRFVVRWGPPAAIFVVLAVAGAAKLGLLTR